MDRFIEGIFNNLIPENKGYLYTTTEDIFIPIYKISLSITKRKQTKLNLVEEMVLRIASCGVVDLDEISGILGLERDILDITIGDLHVKEMAYHSSNKCVIMAKGRDALKELTLSKREKDTITNLYVNALNKDISKDRNSNIVDRCAVDTSKVQHIFDGKDVQFYRDRVGIIKEIFDQESQVYSSESNNIPDELVSIDEIEEINVCFLKMSLHIYISEVGTDIDLISKDNKLIELLDSVKSNIIEQIRKHTLLKNVFTKYPVKETRLPNGNFEDMSILASLIKKYATDKQNQECYYNLIKEKIYCDRVLIDNEFERLWELLLQNANNLSLYIDNLDYWSKNTKFITLLSSIPIKVGHDIYFDNVTNMSLAEKRIKRSIPQITSSRIIEKSHEFWFKIIVDDKLQIIGYPKNIMAIDTNTFITKTIYYLQKK